MQSVGGQTSIGRRARVACPRCGAIVELSRMRVHLREAHQSTSTEVESNLLAARREARRSSRPVRR